MVRDVHYETRRMKMSVCSRTTRRALQSHAVSHLPELSFFNASYSSSSWRSKRGSISTALELGAMVLRADL